MKILSIISEYNPFHNGHKYNIEMSKKKCNCDYTIIIMSGNFLQRGEPAIFDKWSRAKMAILNGADLALELPFIYSCQPAENFAYGALKILDSLNIVDYLCFGSESGDLEELENTAHILFNESEHFKRIIKSKISEGISYPKAIANVVNELHPSFTFTPNNILGIEYIKSKLTLQSKIKLSTIKRIHNNYSDTRFTGSISSARAIRKEILNYGLTKKVVRSIPKHTLDIIKNSMKASKTPISLADFSDIILYQLRNSSLDSIKQTAHVKEGFESRLKKQANNSSTVQELINSVKTKRYTQAFIQRILINCLLGVTKKDTLFSKNNFSPVYFRVLSFNDKGREILKCIKESSSFPTIVKTSHFNSENDFLKRMFYLDILSTDIYNLAYKNHIYKKAGEDFRNSPIYIPNKNIK